MDWRKILGSLCFFISFLLFLFGWWKEGTPLWIAETVHAFWNVKDSSDLVDDGWEIYGSLWIPEVGFQADLFYADETEAAQEVVDAKHSAAWIPTFDSNMSLIADHDYQGFDKMRNAVPGETVAIVDFGDELVQYVCTDVFEGWNTGPDITDMNNESIRGRNDGGIAMYTCNTDLGKETITISFWAIQ